MPLVGRLFAHNKRETQETDIVLTLTPHIIRVLDLTESDLRPFRVGPDGTTALPLEIPVRPPELPVTPPEPGQQPAPAQPGQPTAPGPITPILPPAPAPGRPQ